jgi:hypothetical protein
MQWFSLPDDENRHLVGQWEGTYWAVSSPGVFWALLDTKASVLFSLLRNNRRINESRIDTYANRRQRAHVYDISTGTSH